MNVDENSDLRFTPVPVRLVNHGSMYSSPRFWHHPFLLLVSTAFVTPVVRVYCTWRVLFKFNQVDTGSPQTRETRNLFPVD